MNILRKSLLILITTAVLPRWMLSTAPPVSSSTPIDLAGTWRFAMDRADAGVTVRWFDHDLQDYIALPGILQAQGFGDEISTSTPWVHGLHNRFWYLREEYMRYFECKVGRGRLMVCSADPENSLESRTAARQLRRSLLNYMAGPEFEPAIAAPATDVRALLFGAQIMRKLGAVVQEGGTAANALDGNPNTFWLAGKHGPGYPHELIIRFRAPVAMSGQVCMPRQNHREHQGDIREYAVMENDDGKLWRDLSRGRLVSSFVPQQVRIPRTISTRYLRFAALSGFGSDTTASLAELAAIYAGPNLSDAEKR